LNKLSLLILISKSGNVLLGASNPIVIPRPVEENEQPNETENILRELNKLSNPKKVILNLKSPSR
jgi:hypothetical protein